MPRFRVQVAAHGTEVWEVEAETVDDAWNEWAEGDLVTAYEGYYFEPYDVEEVVED